VSAARRPLGLRREVVFFLPTALFLLVVIALFNLLAHRDALRDLEAERIAAAVRLAETAAADLSQGPPPTAERLSRLAPTATGALVHRDDGRRAEAIGAPTAVDPPALVGAAQPERAVAFGPSRLEAPRVVALAPFEREGRGHVLQLDLEATRLATHLAGVRRLLLLNGAALGALLLLVLLFLRHLLAPFEALLESARRVESARDESARDGGARDGGARDGGAGDRGGGAELDETRFLIETFERAVEALERRDRGDGSDARSDARGDAEDDSVSDDIAALQRTLAPSLESGFMLLDRTGVVLSLNDLGARLLGIDPGAGGRTLPQLLPGDDTAGYSEMTRIVADAVAQGVTVQRRECEVGGAEHRRTIGLGLHPLRRDGEVRGFIVFFTDLSEVKARARQEQISRSLSQLGEIAAGVAHEMRNGLGTLKGYLALIEHEDDQESVRSYLAEMRQESEHLARVLTDFLSFARPESLRGGTIDLGALVGRSVADPTLAGGRIELTPPSAPICLTGDGELLDRALRNLLQNAIEAQQRAGSEAPIAVRVRRDADRAVIEIEDSGPGLPEPLLDTLFQPFVSGRADGVGLGLALAHRIVELHGGELELENRGTGGARATVSLPVTPDT
jgi:signal transduction histidine kinase